MTPSGKHPDLIVWTEAPLNAETPPPLLVDSGVTSAELFYVRNHGPIPDVEPGSYRVEVGGMVERPLAMSVDDLKASFAPVTVEATLACAGNRRAELAAVRPIPGEMPWGAGAVGNAVWTGVRLADVLGAAGVAPGARHVAFTGLDDVEDVDQAAGFGGSIPLEKALTPDVVLAWEMNGEPLRPEHGFPLRAVVPGYIGARSVKWLASVSVQPEPSSNYFQARGYRLFPPDGAGSGIELGELAVNSAVCRVREGPGGTTVAEGYALAGGTRVVTRVDVSVDGGETWAQAALAGDGRPGTWRLWRAELPRGPSAVDLVVRAWDSAASTQPESPAGLWNPKGYVNNAWHRTRGGA